MIHLLSSAYLGPVHYYTKLFDGHPVIEERCDHYVKQTYRNRCLIATADGVLPLTVPVQGRSRAQGGDSKTPMHEMRLSEHGRWREMHLNALTAAYERTPYFEYYVDEFAESIVRPSNVWSISTRLSSNWCCDCSTWRRNGAPTRGTICAPTSIAI